MFREITAEQLEVLLTDYTNINLIDVREPDEWEEGHIAHARSIPLSQFQAREHEVHDVPGDVIFICRSGGRSGRVCEYMTSQGYDVINVDGGMLSWKGEVVTGE